MIIVIKLGTKLLTKPNGILDESNMFRIVEEIGELLDTGIEAIIVSSGAIGAGCGRFRCNPGELSLREKQAAASVGQTDLMNIYRKAFSKQNRLVGQLLLTAENLTSNKSYLNIRNTLFALLKMKVVPVINENDSVAVEEIKFGDNDHLAAMITSKVDADRLIILTDVDGLMDRDGKLIKRVDEIDNEIKNLAGGRGSDFSVGGMITKIDAAKMVKRACGSDTYLANGRKRGVLKKIANGKNPGTVFTAKKGGVSHKKRWIAYDLAPAGSVILDSGAVKAVMENNSSLLPVGVKKIKGEFFAGYSLRCMDEMGREIARGLTNYSSEDLKKIIGKKSNQIEKILGHKDYDEVIHKDNLVIM